MKTQEIRECFTQFFADRGHHVVPSSSLIPGNDPTLLFTNAGMVQFKETFLGNERREYSRATSIQRCVRAGGKHNDLENVGYTARHHTFFEMLGNFSFGDYFKEDAIVFAWQFLTEVLKIPAEKLWITVFEEDKEAEGIWLNKIKVDPTRFSRIGAKDNFWQMGDTGPCGPCTEIFYDHGPEIAGGPPGSPEEDGDRYIEIWNLVFMQYNRHLDGTLEPLPDPSVDTGMGLERVAAVLQGVHDNYDTDQFVSLIQAAAKLAGTDDLSNRSLRVIADHIRSCSFLITDGVVPSNEGRGYVLRRIIRRAARHGHQLGIQEPFFFKLVPTLINVMGKAYPELGEKQATIERALAQEEQQFAKTLEQGIKIFNEALPSLGKEVPGELAFKLYDTYGFPVDLTADIAREHGLGVDMASFDAHMAQQRERARGASQFKVDYNDTVDLECKTTFTGYGQLTEHSKVVDLLDAEHNKTDVLKAQGAVVLPKTSFYAESGGQQGDRGVIRFEGGEFTVTDTQKIGDAFVHYGYITKGALKIGDDVNPAVDAEIRAATTKNHTATHLLHAALRQVLGEHVEQKGSLVTAERLRFDFSHFEPMTADQLVAVEALVNEQIQAKIEAEVIETSIDKAKKLGAMALFGEKYGDEVRVLKVGDFSIELCGGTHVKNTADIETFKIVSESGIAAGVRRIEAITGQQHVDAYLKALQAKREEAALRQQEKTKQQEAEKQKIASLAQQDFTADVDTINGVQVLVKEMSGINAKGLRDVLDSAKQQLKSAVILLAVKSDDKVSLIAGVTDDLTNQFKANELIAKAAEFVGGKGGGRADMAQAGGNLPGRLDEAFSAVIALIRGNNT